MITPLVGLIYLYKEVKVNPKWGYPVSKLLLHFWSYNNFLKLTVKPSFKLHKFKHLEKSFRIYQTSLYFSCGINALLLLSNRTIPDTVKIAIDFFNCFANIFFELILLTRPWKSELRLSRLFIIYIINESSPQMFVNLCAK